MTQRIDERLFGLRERDGIALTVRRWTSDARPRAVMVVAHGMGEHADRYRTPLAPLIADGIVIYALDHRGHGAAALAAGTLGDYGPGGFAGVISDLIALIETARAEYPDLPLVLFGHSMGSMIAQALVLDHAAAIDGLCLSGSAAVDVVAAKGAEEPDLFAALNGAFEPARTGFEWLSRDTAEVDAYAADPLCGFELEPVSMGELFSQGARLADPELLAKIPASLPIWIGSGEADPLHRMIGAVEPLIARYRAAGLSVEARLYPEARHEILNEINRDEIVGDLRVWLERLIAVA